MKMRERERERNKEKIVFISKGDLIQKCKLPLNTVDVYIIEQNVNAERRKKRKYNAMLFLLSRAYVL